MSINGRTKVFGIMGFPVSHSLSPLIHNAAFQKIGYNGVYVPFQVENPDSELAGSLLKLGISGLSVTIPHKTWAANIASQKDDLTEISGSANTLLLKHGIIIAKNTDGPGALRALKEAGTLLQKKVLILGYGGSALAIAHALLLEKEISSLTIYGRNLQKAEEFANSLNKKHTANINFTNLSNNRAEDFDIIINTTPLGMQGRDAIMPLPESLIDSHQTVFDIVYVPSETPLLIHAKEKKAEIVKGYLMLLYQAIMQFELFTEEKAPEDLMHSLLLDALAKKDS